MLFFENNISSLPQVFSNLICSTNFLHDIDEHEIDCLVNLLIWASDRQNLSTSRIVHIVSVKKISLLVLKF